MLKSLYDAVLNFSELWFLWGISLVVSIKDAIKRGFTLRDVLGFAGLYGIFGYLIWLFDLGIGAWLQIGKESGISESLLTVLKLISLSAGYMLTKNYLLKNSDYRPAKNSHRIVHFFYEFFACCGGIGCFIGLLLILFIIQAINHA